MSATTGKTFKVPFFKKKRLHYILKRITGYVLVIKLHTWQKCDTVGTLCYVISYKVTDIITCNNIFKFKLSEGVYFEKT